MITLPAPATALCPPPSRWRKVGRSWSVSVGLYLAVILVATWPLAQFATTHLPQGPTLSTAVPLFNLWTFEWNADRATHGFQGYWDAPIFAPARGTFAFSEPQPTSLILAPLIRCLGAGALAYNLYFGLALLLNGLVTEALLRSRGIGAALARTGGIAMLLLPAVHWQRDVVQLVPLWGVLWVWWAADRVSQQATLRRGVELGLAASVTSAMCLHYGLFVAILAAGGGWTLLRRVREGRTWVAWGVAVLVAGVLAGPLAWKVHHTLRQYQFERDVDVLSQLSLQLVDYRAAWGQVILPWGQQPTRQFWAASPGMVRMGLAVVGVVWGLLRRRTRRWTLFLTLTGLVAMGLSLGVNLRWGAWSLWDRLAWIPGLAQVRSCYRFSFFFQMVCVLLAVQALHTVYQASCFWCGRPRFVARSLIVGLAGLTMFEVLPWKMELAAVPDRSAHAKWVEYVRTYIPPDKAIVHIPFSLASHLQSFEKTTEWMLIGLGHRVPMLNGYSGFFTDEETEFRGLFSENGVTNETLEYLLAHHVVLLVVERKHFPTEWMVDREYDKVQLRLVHSDPVGVDLYELFPRLEE